MTHAPEFTQIKPLKEDKFGTVELVRLTSGQLAVRRYYACAQPVWRSIARSLAYREAKALQAIGEITAEGIPTRQIAQLIYFDQDHLFRTYLEATPLDKAGRQNTAFFEDAMALIERLHGGGVLHRDLEKSSNWLVLPNGRAGLVDFQLAVYSPRRGLWFKARAADDRRYILKNKKRFCHEPLSAQEEVLLARRTMLNRFWRGIIKPCYRFITRRIFRWSDRANSKYSH